MLYEIFDERSNTCVNRINEGKDGCWKLSWHETVLNNEENCMRSAMGHETNFGKK